VGELEKVCVNCKYIIPHVHEYIDNEWKHNAKCAKVCMDGRLFTIPNKNTYNCKIYEEKAKVFPKSDDI
tara:strand:+ start:3606 stop:3812 length:207 start_codon:yes stop_codon:yes gene_type:complete